MTNLNLGNDRICLVLALVLFAGCSVHKAQDLDALQDARAANDFNGRIQAYISIHHQAEEQSGLASHPESLNSAKEIAKRKGTMAKQIALLRKDLREGEIFTPELRTYFIRALDSAYQGNPEAISTAVACAPKCDEQMVSANTVYPDHLGFSVMTPTMLRRLPALPEELEYRIVNRDLIIRDREANLIVDVMRNAVAATPEGADCND
jgi:hypothetical protein